LWVLRAQCGDRGALEDLLRLLEPPLRRYLVGMIGTDEAEDVLQDVLILVYRKLSFLNDPDLLRPWVFRIASRSAIRHLKKRHRWSEKRDDSVALEAIAAVPAPVDARSIPELLASHPISPACRAVLALHFGEQMTLAEVAAVLEIPLGTAKSRLAYGLALLRKRLNERSA
jgi:RNA polymerase sigma-70 factor (ECF subfamily)